MSASGSHRQVGPTCQCRAKRKKEKGQRVFGPDLSPGFCSSWASWAEPGPSPSLLLFFFAADSLGPRVGVSGIPCGFFLIRCELQRVCACVCCVCWAGSPRRERDVAAWARRCSLATAARPSV